MDGARPDLRTAAVDAEAAHATSDAAVVLPERWRLVELLGSGGQATVWLAEDRVLGQQVALKILRAGADERTRARWLEEVRQGRRLAHPNLIRIHDVIEASDRPAAVMEFLPGGTLADRVRGAGAQPVEDVVRWAGEVLEVLGYLHEQRIVHRDVKPSNLLVAEDGRVKLSDLGLVRSLDRDSELTATMEGVGTPRFMAPEQLRGEPPTPACDLYSLGVALYQLLTGRLPFDGDSAFQIADGHLHAEPTPVREHRPECPRWLARFVERLLEKDP
ncbi:MAG: serine/threonine protein kinase, partial [Thermoanaerobaculales bacterium]|nr:serine/threonine protein kinase [Thermoanaerobaculales bacterium]